MPAGLLHGRAAAWLTHTVRKVERPCRFQCTACRSAQLPSHQSDHGASVPQGWSDGLVAQAQKVRVQGVHGSVPSYVFSNSNIQHDLVPVPANMSA
jgi:hypothetical protein